MLEPDCDKHILNTSRLNCWLTGTSMLMIVHRTVQEREQDYSKARARIFGMQHNADASMSPQNSPQMQNSSLNMMNGSRPPNLGPMSGRGRGPPARMDQGKKAVFRNREQDLQDPDYRRGVNYRCWLLAYCLFVVAFKAQDSLCQI